MCINQIIYTRREKNVDKCTVYDYANAHLLACLWPSKLACTASHQASIQACRQVSKAIIKPARKPSNHRNRAKNRAVKQAGTHNKHSQNW